MKKYNQRNLSPIGFKFAPQMQCKKSSERTKNCGRIFRVLVGVPKKLLYQQCTFTKFILFSCRLNYIICEISSQVRKKPSGVGGLHLYNSLSSLFFHQTIFLCWNSMIQIAVKIFFTVISLYFDICTLILLGSQKQYWVEAWVHPNVKVQTKHSGSIMALRFILLYIYISTFPFVFFLLNIDNFLLY